MEISEISNIEKKLLSTLQHQFPMDRQPYRQLGDQFGTTEADIIAMIQGLREKGLVRQIGPVLDARRLGFQSTLVATQVTESEQGKAEGILTAHPGISHAYQRNHMFNIWFTLTVPSGGNIDNEMEQIADLIGASVNISLPALRLFKIGAFFGIEGDGEPPISAGQLLCKIELDEADRKVINAVQEDLPLKSSPFDDMATKAGMGPVEFIERCRSFVESGVIRRFGASVNHRRVGYGGNGMVCWRVPADLVTQVGGELAAIGAVSHCYERRLAEAWPYNVFAMFHGLTVESCLETVQEASQRLGLGKFLVLFSTREIKKTRVKYPV